MIRLIQGQGKNSPQEYDKIFKERQKKGVNWADIRRWEQLLRYFKGGSLLDIGCLDSLIPKILSRRDDIWGYIGIDTAKECIKTMKNGIQCQYEVGDAYNLRFKNDSFNYVVMGEILEHLERPEDAIKEAVRVLKPKGVLAISVPFNEAMEPGACDRDRHVWSYDEQDMYDLLGKYGKVKTKILRSKWFPYRYCFPQLLTFLTKI